MPIERISKTVADVVAAIKRQFGDTSGVQVNDAFIVAWVNDAQREIVTRNTELKPALIAFDVTAGLDSYPLLEAVPDILTVRSVHYKGQIIHNKSFLEAQEYIIRNTDIPFESAPRLWYEYAGVITLWPVPDVSTSEGLKIFYCQTPTLVASISDVLSIPDSYFNAIVDYCMWQAYEMDSDFPASQIKQQQFEQAVTSQANRTQSQNDRYPTVKILPEDNWYYGY